jgi:type VI secretion system secreted protein Hcp
MPIYMKVPGVEGTGKGNRCGWIVLESCQIGTQRHLASPTGTGSNRDASAPAVNEIVVTKVVDISSTNLFRLSNHGEPVTVFIEFVSQDSKSDVPTMSLELESTFITSYTTTGAGGASPRGRAMESMSLNFTKITYSTTAIESAKDGKQAPNRAQWDLFIQKGA